MDVTPFYDFMTKTCMIKDKIDSTLPLVPTTTISNRVEIANEKNTSYISNKNSRIKSIKNFNYSKFRIKNLIHFRT